MQELTPSRRLILETKDTWISLYSSAAALAVAAFSSLNIPASVALLSIYPNTLARSSGVRYTSRAARPPATISLGQAP